MKFTRGFKYAFNGFANAFRTQINMRVHVIMSLLVISAGIYFHITSIEWCLIAFCIGSVFATELLNTSFEYTVDLASPDYNSKAGKAKDMAAAAVLIISIMSVIIGAIIFLPKIIERINS